MSEAEADAVAVSPAPVHVDSVVCHAFVTPPASSQPPLFLAGAGVRGMQIGGKFIKFTAIGVYLDQSAIRALSAKWAGKTPDQLAAAPDFYTDIIYGPFDKFTRVTMILPLTGEQYSDKVSENCEAQWKAAGILTNAELDALTQFKQVFKPETFPPGTSILFTHSASGALSIAFSKDESVPETNAAVIENKPLCYGILESIIGEHGVSPEAKRSLAVRICELLKPPSTTNKQEEVGANAVAINA